VGVVSSMVTTMWGRLQISETLWVFGEILWAASPTGTFLVWLIWSRQPRRGLQSGDQPFHFFLCSMNREEGDADALLHFVVVAVEAAINGYRDGAGWGVSGRRWHKYPFHVSKKCRDEAGSCVWFPARLCPSWWYHHSPAIACGPVLCLCVMTMPTVKRQRT